MKKIYKIVFKHYLIGLLVILIGFWSIGELPSWFTIERDWIQWLITILSIPIIGVFISKRINKYLYKGKKNIYLLSVLMIFLTWILTLYSKAIIIGIVESFEFGRLKVLDSIVGYTIYQLWIYSGLGILHGLLSGFLLSKDLKKLKKKPTHVN